MQQVQRVVIGVDPHKLSATIEVVDASERMLGAGRFTTDQAGYSAMRRYAKTWPVRVWAVEGANGLIAAIADAHSLDAANARMPAVDTTEYRTERPDGVGENVVVSGYDGAKADAFLADPYRWRRPRRLGDEQPAAQVVDVLVEMRDGA